MEVAGGKGNKLMVALYEGFGTSLLVYAVLISHGNAFAVAPTLFALLCLFGGITGGHYNPAVTMGVFIGRKKLRQDCSFWLLITLFQCMGGLIGILWAYLALMPTQFGGDNTLVQSWIPRLCPTGATPEGQAIAGCDPNLNRAWSTFYFQMFCTFIFVSTILTAKSEVLAPTKDGLLGNSLVAMTLFAMINCSQSLGGACYNPAVAIGQLVFGVYTTDDADLRKEQSVYAWCFTIGPLIGGLLAGNLVPIMESNLKTI